MASRVLPKLLLNATLRREKCVVSALSRLSIRSHSVISRCPYQQTGLVSSRCQHIAKLNYCTDTIPSEPQPTGQSYICKLQGVPWRTTKDEIEDFLKAGDVENASINFSYFLNGQFTGIVYVVLQSQTELDAVLNLDKKNIGDRYVNIYEASEEEFKSKSDTSFSNTLRLTGLPYRADRDDIKSLFKGLDVLPNGVKIILNREAQSIGVAYVRFTTPEMANEALERNGAIIGERYITMRIWTPIPRGGVTRHNMKSEGL